MRDITSFKDKVARYRNSVIKLTDEGRRIVQELNAGFGGIGYGEICLSSVVVPGMDKDWYVDQTMKMIRRDNRQMSKDQVRLVKDEVRSSLENLVSMGYVHID